MRQHGIKKRFLYAKKSRKYAGKDFDFILAKKNMTITISIMVAIVIFSKKEKKRKRYEIG